MFKVVSIFHLLKNNYFILKLSVDVCVLDKGAWRVQHVLRHVDPLRRNYDLRYPHIRGALPASGIQGLERLQH